MFGPLFTPKLLKKRIGAFGEEDMSFTMASSEIYEDEDSDLLSYTAKPEGFTIPCA